MIPGPIGWQSSVNLDTKAINTYDPKAFSSGANLLFFSFLLAIADLRFKGYGDGAFWEALPTNYKLDLKICTFLNVLNIMKSKLSTWLFGAMGFLKGEILRVVDGLEVLFREIGLKDLRIYLSR